MAATAVARRQRWFASAAVRLRVHCVVPRRRLLRVGVLRSCRRPLLPTRKKPCVVLQPFRRRRTRQRRSYRCPRNGRRRRRRRQNRLQRRPATTAAYSFWLSLPLPVLHHTLFSHHRCRIIILFYATRASDGHSRFANPRCTAVVFLSIVLRFFALVPAALSVQWSQGAEIPVNLSKKHSGDTL